MARTFLPMPLRAMGYGAEDYLNLCKEILNKGEEMNKAQKKIIFITCFVIGGLLILTALRHWYFSGYDLDDLIKFGNLYLGIIFIGAGFFFLKMRVKDE